MVNPGKKNTQAAVHPNPLEGNVINISAGSEPLPVDWKLLDAGGRTINPGVLRQRNQQVSTGNLGSRVYYLYIGTREVIKLMK
jgi:hypothetical protein